MAFVETVCKNRWQQKDPRDCDYFIQYNRRRVFFTHLPGSISTDRNGQCRGDHRQQQERTGRTK